MNISKVGIDFSKKAAQEGKHLVQLPLKEHEIANILWNKNAVDCYITSGNKITGARGAQGTTQVIKDEIIKISEKLKDSILPDVNVLAEFIKSLSK